MKGLIGYFDYTLCENSDTCKKARRSWFQGRRAFILASFQSQQRNQILRVGGVGVLDVRWVGVGSVGVGVPSIQGFEDGGLGNLEFS